MLVTRQLSSFVARELSAMFASRSGGGDAADKALWEVFVVRLKRRWSAIASDG